MEIKFCRRCAASLKKLNETAYECSNGHKIYYAGSPAAAAIVVTADGKIALTVRAVDPGKGKNSLFGGFTDYGENLEQALARELQEEAGLTASDYETPRYLLSAADDYAWQGNITPVLSTLFFVRLKPGVTIIPADDVADVIYVAPDAVPWEAIAFPSNIPGIKAAIAILRGE